MLTLLRQLKTQGIRLVEGCLLPFSLFLFTLHFLFFHLARLRRAEVIILPEKLNFAGTVWVPDFARHRFPHKRLLFLGFYEPLHNHSHPLIWEDISNVDCLVMRRMAIDFSFRGKCLILPGRQLYDPLVRKILMFFAKFGGRAPVFLDYLGLYGGAEIPEEYKDQFEEVLRQEENKERADVNNVTMKYGTYFYLQRTESLPSPSLPGRHLTEITQALDNICSRRPRKGTCGVYLKKNKAASPGHRRMFDGGNFEEYLPAFRLLIERGYQILLTGDRPLPPELSDEFEGMIVDARIQSLGVPTNLFKLYAALHTDIFIGDMGGGIPLACLRNNRPVLALNVFVFGSAYNNLWIYFKHAYHHDGRHLSFAEMTGEYVYAYAANVPEDFITEHNTADEVLGAVQCYLDEVENPGTSQIDKSLEDLWPFYSYFKMGGCHISPAYVRNYHRKRALDHASRPLNKAS